MIARHYLKLFLSLFIGIACYINLSAQHTRSKHNWGLKGMYLNANLGIINYNYDRSLLADGVTVEDITGTTTFAGRFALGYHLDDFWDVQLSVMRPAAWATYKNISLDQSNQTVWTNIWALSTKKNFSLTSKSKFYL